MAAAVLPPSSTMNLPSIATFKKSMMATPESAGHPVGFLAHKMSAHRGYDATTMQTVSKLAASNTIEAACKPSENFLLDGDALSDFVSDSLLNPAKLRSQNLSLNSNEPVLLLSISKTLELEVQKIRDVKQDLLTVLSARGVRPVRVYVRMFGEENGDGVIKIELLNVVNTNIGGPSMVQLLDAAFHGEGWWKEGMVVKEAWNGLELMWRDEAWSWFGEPVAEASVKLELEPEIVGESDEKEAEEEAVATMTEAVETQERPVVTRHKSVDDVPEDEEKPEPVSVEHPAWKQLREKEAQKPDPQYPTWSRDHDSTTYLDIIMTQSSDVRETGPVSTISGKPASEEEGFEIVDKP